MEDKGEVLYELGPKFDFFYEMTMPTGKKMRSSFVSAIKSYWYYFNCTSCVFWNYSYS